mmetsp:Transcript_2916/g.11117  ORF Transcript_2916/g.11117 Transcript_2916/m.11117 type:complete len:127 (-) Transcript_2916:2017-2397(-)
MVLQKEDHQVHMPFEEETRILTIQEVVKAMVNAICPSMDCLNQMIGIHRSSHDPHQVSMEMERRALERQELEQGVRESDCDEILPRGLDPPMEHSRYLEPQFFFETFPWIIGGEEAASVLVQVSEL